MHIAGLIILLLQIAIAVHVVRSRRSLWWLLVIFLFPLIGIVIYFLIELMPELRMNRAVRALGRDIAEDIKRAVTPDATLHRRAEELATCGSIDNKLALAEECMARGQFDDAIALYESARQGQFADAPNLLLGLARVRFLNGEPQAARTLLQRVAAANPHYYPQDVAILMARAADAAGDHATALRELEAMLDRSVGLEARYRHAEILARVGEPEKAKAELKRLVSHARRFRIGPTERQWARASRRMLASLG